jgi:DNA-binding response OmpR family regulator
MSAPASSARTILVADDDLHILSLVRNYFRKRNFHVIEASDGDEAMQLVLEHEPSLVILDVMMPGQTGWEVCRSIREHPRLAGTGVIMLTGIGENLNEMTSPLYGADAHIDKPFDFGELDRRIKETLARRRAGVLGRDEGEPRDEGATSAGAAAVRTTTLRAAAAPKPRARPKTRKPARAVAKKRVAPGAAKRSPQRASRKPVPKRRRAPAKKRSRRR